MLLKLLGISLVITIVLLMLSSILKGIKKWFNGLSFYYRDKIELFILTFIGVTTTVLFVAMLVSVLSE